MRAWGAALLLSAALATLAASQARPTEKGGDPPPLSPAQAVVAAEVLAVERMMERAVVNGDTAYLDSMTPADFTFTHGDGWTAGGPPIRVDTKKSWLASVGQRPYTSRELGPVAAEVHGDIVITYGRYRMRMRATPDAPQTSVWFERVYAKQAGRWLFLSHRTVNGPLREAASEGAGR